MQPRLQRRIQRCGWDRAAAAYDPLWRSQLAPAQAAVMACAGIVPGERVLDVACGTGATALDAAAHVLPAGEVVGVDLSGCMVDAARMRARERNVTNVRFERMDAERLELPDETFDVALCTLGLMYLPHPEQALLEMRRMLCPGGRMALAVWGARARCGWAEVFPIIDAEIESEVCPLFFRLGQPDALAALCTEAGLPVTRHFRISTTLNYSGDEEACAAAFVAGPVALAWSRLDKDARTRARRKYLEAIASWREGETYRIPGEFVVVAASADQSH